MIPVKKGLGDEKRKGGAGEKDLKKREASAVQEKKIGRRTHGGQKTGAGRPLRNGG